MQRIALILASVALLASAPDAEAQRYYGSRGTRVQLGDGIPDVPGGFTFCRLAFQSVRRLQSGRGWTTDFPEADRNLMTRLSELTTTPIAMWEHGEPGFVPVRATDPELYQCPFLMATHVGELGFAEDEVEALRDYLLKGGFLWADDFWGSRSWDWFEAEIRRVLPEFDIVDLPLDHPLLGLVYNVTEIPQIPSINRWGGSGESSSTSELGADSAVPHMRAIFDTSGQLLVLITHNTDISDGWEREGYDPSYFALFSPDAYAIAVNVTVWIMTH